VHDDGMGFPSEAGSPEGHLGLRLIEETVADSGGRLDITATSGEGTHVVGTLPL
jgi:two-component system NarL family sensor kinase